MSMRYPGGFIASTPVTAAYPSGVWTQAQAIPYQAQNVWTRDQYWPYTTLLLQGNGTNGAQNNTFLDSSSNAFTITRNGNTTQGSFTPYEANGYWSNYFNGSTDFLTTPTQTAFAFGTGAFTVEAWVYLTANNTYNRVIGLGIGASGSTPHYTAWALQLVSLNLSWYRFDGSETAYTSSATAALNTWNHIVAVRDGSNNFAMFLNGVRVFNQTVSLSYNAVNSDPLYIGRTTFGGGTPSLTAGYVSNARIVKGSAVYDPTQTTLTVPTAPLTAITNTSLLTCQSNRFVDNSSSAYAITVNGSPSVQAFQPFPGATTYSGTVLGGSGYFDGTGDYLTLAPGSAFAFGTGDFTVEAWIYPTAAPGQMYIIDARNSGQTSTWSFNFAYGGTNNELDWGSSGSIIANGGTTSVIQNAWNHVVYTRSGTSGALFANGVRVASVTDSTNYSTSPTTSYIGSRFSADAPYFFQGYMAVRVVKGTAVYDPTQSTLTVPTAPLTAVTNTQLLLNFTNAGIFDAAVMNDLETVGNAQVSTSVVKYGTGSMAFDGSGDVLKAPNTQNVAFGTGDFTVEMWVYPNSFSTSPVIFDTRNANGNTAGIALTFNTSGNPRVFVNGGFLFTGSSVAPISMWSHLAMVKAGGVITLYLNGVSIGSAASSTSLTDTAITIGDNIALNSAYNGYIDDLRITKGAARYITNFTPPPARMPGQ